MVLGVNFQHDPKQPIRFDAEAVRQLRPGVVRIVLHHPHEVGDWIDAVRRAKLRAIWGFLPDLHGVKATTIAAEFLIRSGLDTVEAIEIGSDTRQADSVTHLVEAFQLAECFIARSEILADGTLRAAFGPHRPVILQTGREVYNAGSALFHGRILDVIKSKRAERLILGSFHAVALAVVAPGVGWPTYVVRSFQSETVRRLNLPISVLRVGWREGDRLTWLRSMGEAIRAHGEGKPWRRPRTLEPEIRRRWYLNAYDEADRLGALHFIAEAETIRSPLDVGANLWAMYRHDDGRIDPIWTALQYRGRGARIPSP